MDDSLHQKACSWGGSGGEKKMRFLIKTQNMVTLQNPSEFSEQTQSPGIIIDSNGPWRVDPRSGISYRYGCSHREQSFLLSPSLMGHWANGYQLIGFEPLQVVLETVWAWAIIDQGLRKGKDWWGSCSGIETYKIVLESQIRNGSFHKSEIACLGFMNTCLLWILWILFILWVYDICSTFDQILPSYASISLCFRTVFPSVFLPIKIPLFYPPVFNVMQIPLRIYFLITNIHDNRNWKIKLFPQ